MDSDWRETPSPSRAIYPVNLSKYPGPLRRQISLALGGHEFTYLKIESCDRACPGTLRQTTQTYDEPSLVPLTPGRVRGWVPGIVPRGCGPGDSLAIRRGCCSGFITALSGVPGGVELSLGRVSFSQISSTMICTKIFVRHLCHNVDPLSLIRIG